jgi:3',5'-cyclic AMP phosphodiesterase CpdA
MPSLLHLSDTHFGTEQPQVLDALVEWTKERRPDVLVFSGDITQRARAAQFAAARSFVERLGIARRLVIPGNHDIPLVDLWARWRRPYAAYARAFGSDLEPVIDEPAWLVIGANTTRAWRHKHGQVDAGQIERVTARLRAARSGQLRIVVTHQPCEVPRADARKDLLRGREAALAAWAAAGADLVLGGHIHLPGVMRWEASTSAARGATARGVMRELAAVNEESRGLWVALAGTAVSSRVRPDAPHSVNLVSWDPQQRQATVEQWDFAGESTQVRAWRCVRATATGGSPASS